MTFPLSTRSDNRPETQARESVELGVQQKTFQVLKLLRIRQWVKNLFVFAPLLFSKNLLNGNLFLITLLTFFSFSLAASSAYAINDIADMSRDRLHPVKRNRPLASGQMSPRTAAVVAALCLLCGVLLAALVNLTVLVIICGYVAINVFYSFLGKRVIILDVILISIGFVLRVIAGSSAINVKASEWISDNSYGSKDRNKRHVLLVQYDGSGFNLREPNLQQHLQLKGE